MLSIYTYTYCDTYNQYMPIAVLDKMSLFLAFDLVKSSLLYVSYRIVDHLLFPILERIFHRLLHNWHKYIYEFHNWQINLKICKIRKSEIKISSEIWNQENRNPESAYPPTVDGMVGRTRASMMRTSSLAPSKRLTPRVPKH